MADDVKVKESIDKGTVAAAKSLESENYPAGFKTDIDTEYAPKGLNEDVIRFISDRKGEPSWMLDWRLQAFERWKTMDEPDWAKVDYEKVPRQGVQHPELARHAGAPAPAREEEAAGD